EQVKERTINLEKQFEKSEKQRIATLSVLTDLNKTTVNLKAEITERKQAEKELTKLSTAVKQSPSVIAITDLDGNLEYVNPKFTELTGYTFEEAKGKNPRILKSGEQPDEMFKELWKTISSGKEWRGEFHNKKKNGDLYWEMASISPIFDEQGKIINYIKVAEDITEAKKARKELRKSEEKYRSLISTAAEGFWMIDINNKTINVNDSFCKILGYTKDEILGKTPFDFVDEENAEIFKDKIFKAKAVEHRSFEITLLSKTGRKIPTLFNATSQFNSKGEREGCFAFITDISALKAAEKEIANRLKEKTALIQEIYHRTKNNMAVIKAMLSMESRRSDNEFVKSTFREVNNKIQAMALVHQKLYKAKDLSNIDLKEYIADLTKMIMQSYGVLAEKIKVNLEMNDIIISIDYAVPLGLIINELISNIFKHAFPNRQEGVISIRLFREKDKTINLELADNGIGFPKKFDPRKDGSMGLASVFSVIEYQLKGEVSIKSEKGLKWHIKINDENHKNRV
ncbi:MAG: PAS domain S-box protein, partial [Candidatus Cloacimonadota bacterium]|nr:PAS domain S-box protein [Candidatus Cloacimonadota bacterium]